MHYYFGGQLWRQSDNSKWVQTCPLNMIMEIMCVITCFLVHACMSANRFTYWHPTSRSACSRLWARQNCVLYEMSTYERAATNAYVLDTPAVIRFGVHRLSVESLVKSLCVVRAAAVSVERRCRVWWNVAVQTSDTATMSLHQRAAAAAPESIAADVY